MEGKKIVVKNARFFCFCIFFLPSSCSLANRVSTLKKNKLLMNKVFQMLFFKNLSRVMSNIFFLWRDGVIHLSTSSIIKWFYFLGRERKTFNRVWRKLVIFFQLWIIPESHEVLKFWFLPLVLDLYYFQSESIFPINLIIQESL